MDISNPYEFAAMQYSPHGATAGPSASRPSSRLSGHDTTLNNNEVATAQHRHKNMMTRRPKHADLDWDGNRQTLYELYMRDGMVLSETMKIMKKNHDFDAT